MTKTLREHICDPVYESAHMKELRREKEKLGYAKRRPLAHTRQRIRNTIRNARYKLAPDELNYNEIPTNKMLENLHQTNIKRFSDSETNTNNRLRLSLREGNRHTLREFTSLLLTLLFNKS